MQAAQSVDWKSLSEALNDLTAILQWFSDGLANTCYNAVDRHVLEGYGKGLNI